MCMTCGRYLDERLPRPEGALRFAGSVQLFYLERIMGTSVQQLDQTYGHLLPDSEAYLRGLLDAYDGVRRRFGAAAVPAPPPPAVRPAHPQPFVD